MHWRRHRHLTNPIAWLYLGLRIPGTPGRSSLRCRDHGEDRWWGSHGHDHLQMLGQDPKIIFHVGCSRIPRPCREWLNSTGAWRSHRWQRCAIRTTQTSLALVHIIEPTQNGSECDHARLQNAVTRSRKSQSTIWKFTAPTGHKSDEWSPEGDGEACEKESDHVAPSGVPLQSRPATLGSIALTMWGFSLTLYVYAGGTTSIEVGTGTSVPPWWQMLMEVPMTMTRTTNQYNGKDSKCVQKHTKAASEHETQGPAFPMGEGTNVWARRHKIPPGRYFTLECLVVRTNEGGWVVGNQWVGGQCRVIMRGLEVTTIKPIGSALRSLVPWQGGFSFSRRQKKATPAGLWSNCRHSQSGGCSDVPQGWRWRLSWGQRCWGSLEQHRQLRDTAQPWRVREHPSAPDGDAWQRQRRYLNIPYPTMIGKWYTCQAGG